MAMRFISDGGFFHSEDEDACLRSIQTEFEVWAEELWTVKLGLKLLAERTRFQTSQWRPYIQNLPKRFTVPIFYTAAEIQAIQYLPLTHQASNSCFFQQF